MSTWNYRSVYVRALVGISVAAVHLALAGCRDGNKAEAPPIQYGVLRTLAKLPDGARTSIATVDMIVETPDGKDEVHKAMPWACADTMQLPVGPKEIEVVARDASGSVVYRSKQHAQVAENQTVDVAVTDWQKTRLKDMNSLAAWATLGALVIALALGGARKFSLAVLLLDHRWLVLPIALVTGFTFATVAVYFWQGTNYLASTALPSLWMLLIPTFVAYAALLELRFVVLSLVPLDSLVVAALIGIASGIGSLGLPMILTNGFPWLAWLGAGAVASVALQVYLHERL